MIKPVFAVAVLLSVVFSLQQPNPTRPLLTWWVASGLEKVRPFDQEPSPPRRVARVSAARNEFEPFQIILRSASADVADVDLDVTDLRNDHNDVISKSNVTTYSERYLALHKPSSIDGAAGEWPDPLIPRTDRYAKERRNAFPFRLLRGRNQPLWIELYIPNRCTARKPRL